MLRDIKETTETTVEKTPTTDSSVSKGRSSFNLSRVALFFAFALLLGSASGFGFWKFTAIYSDNTIPTQTSTKEAVEVVGIVDKKTFSDSAEGTLREGGSEGEGTHFLERHGGENQNVYLTSSTVDMTEYTDKKVRVWGKTYAGEKVAWLMDVGLIEVLE